MREPRNEEGTAARVSETPSTGEPKGEIGQLPRVTILPRVTMEPDIGPVEVAFGYVPMGDPAYSDVPSDLAPCENEGAAEVAGAVMVGIGNWRSFTVEKRYYAVEST